MKPPTGSGVRVTLVLIVLAAAALRLWNIGAGVPYAVGPDEPQVMHRVVHMMTTGDLNPHFFHWPSLTFYLNLIVATLTFLAGSMRGMWSHLDQVSAADFYLTARQFTALVGAGTVALTFLAARAWGNRVALIAAALMAVIPPHVRESHYVLTDVPTAFFTTLALVMALRASDLKTTGSFAWAGLAVGLAASCKYNGSITVVLPLLAVAGAGGTVGIKLLRSLLVIGMVGVGFVAGTPYAVLDLPAFLNDYARLAAHFAKERGGEAGWSIYAKHVLGAVAWPALVAVAAGVVLAVRQGAMGPDRTRAWMLIAFAGLYFAVMAGSFQIFGRYMMPLYPVLCILAAMAVTEAMRHLPRLRLPIGWRMAAATGLIALVLVLPATNAVRFSRNLGRPSTVDLAYRWLMEHAPAGSRIAVEYSILDPPQKYYTVRARSLVDRTFDDYRRDGIEYFLAGSPAFQAALADPNANRDVYVAYRRLFEQASEVAAFDATRDVSGPTLRIFQVVK